MKKNILAENMLRFGVKNLSESDVTRLTEAEVISGHNDVVRDLDMMVKYMNSQVKQKKSKPESLWNTNFLLKPNTFSWKHTGKGTYDLKFGDKVNIAMNLPHNVGKATGRMYEYQFMNEISTIINSITGNDKNPFRVPPNLDQQKAASQLIMLLKDMRKALTGKFATAFDNYTKQRLAKASKGPKN